MAEANDSTARMETLHAAIARLERAGYAAELRAISTGFRDGRTGRIHSPEDLIVDEIVRFEGESDPADEAVLYALRTREGVRGTFAATFGPSADPVAAELTRRLRIDERTRRPGARRISPNAPVTRPA
jgi:hypothetical protein